MKIGVASLVVYLVLLLGVRPHARAALRGSNEGATERAVVYLGLIELATHVAAIFLVSCLLALGVFALATRHGGTAADLQDAVERVQGLRQFFTEIGGAWSLAGFVLLLLGLAIMTVRLKRTRWQELHAYLVERAVTRRLEGEEWEALPPTEVMQAIESDIEELRPKVACLREARSLQADANTAIPSRLEALEQRLVELQDEHVRHDAARRITGLDPDAFLPPPARTLPLKLLRLLLSRGTFGLIRGPRKWAFVGALTLVVPASMYVAGTTGASSLQEKELELEDVQLGLLESDAMVALAKVEAAGPPEPSTWTDADESDLDDLADHFERATLAHLSAQSAAVRVPGLVSVVTREAILREVAAEPAHGLRPPTQVTEPARVRVATTTRTASLKVHSVTDEVLSQGLRHRFRNDLRKLALERPKLWTQIRAHAGRFRGAFGREIGPAELRRMLVSHAIDGIAGGEVGLATDHVQQRSVAHHRYTAQKASFLRNIAEGKSVVGTYDAVADLQWRTPHVGVPDASKDMFRFEALERMATEGKLEVGISQRPARALQSLNAPLDGMQAQRSKLGMSTRSLKSAVAAYEDHFATSSKWQPVKEGMLKARNALGASKTSAAFRGRNFRAALSSRWTGGVVLGRSGIETGIPLDFIDLRWERRADGMSLTFVPASGAPVTFERLSPEIVRAALAFAADDRKVAVTMVYVAHGLLKVMLHPALVDTRVGCMVTDLDQVVFDVLPDREQNKLTTTFQEYRSALELYGRAREEALEVVLERLVGDAQQALVQGDLTMEARAAVDNLRGLLNRLRATRPARHAEMQHNLESVREPQAILTDPQLSPMVIEAIGACAARSPRTARCLVEELKQRTRSLGGAAVPDSLFQDVQYDGRSIVGEREYLITPSLAFARPHGIDALPFFFRAQFAITIDEDEREPLILAEAQPAIDRGVRAWLLARQAAGDPIVSEVESFTLLQRLFRVALSGQLGERFPVQRLASLAGATRPATPSTFRTPEWSLHEVDLTKVGNDLASDAAKLEAAGGLLAARFAGCAGFLKSLGSQRELLAAAPAERWNVACPRELVDEAAPLAKSGNVAAWSAAAGLLRLHEALELQQELQRASEHTMHRRGQPACAR